MPSAKAMSPSDRELLQRRLQAVRGYILMIYSCAEGLKKLLNLFTNWRRGNWNMGAGR